MKRKTLKWTWFGLLAAALSLAAAFAQDSGDKVQDPDKYRVEYAAYQDALKKEGDEKANALLEFMKRFPDSSLIPYAKPEFVKLITQAHGNGDAEKVIALSEQLLEVAPGEIAPVFYSADILLRKGRFGDTIPWAERLYKHGQADQSTKNQAAYMVAFAALKTGQTGKVKQYGPQAVGAYPPKDTYTIAAELMKQEAKDNDLRDAAEYAEKFLNGASAADSNADAELKKYLSDNRLTARVLIGESAYELGNFQKAISEFRRVLQMTGKQSMVGQAYYKIGMSYWKMNRIDPEAMQNFARGHKLGSGQFARQCRKHLEELYKARHNGSTAGIDEYIDKAVSSA